MENNIYDYKFINTATTTQVVNTAATLGKVILPFTTIGTIDIYDATSGTTSPVAHFPIGSVGNTYIFEVTVGNGIRVVTSASDNLTIAFKVH